MPAPLVCSGPHLSNVDGVSLAERRFALPLFGDISALLFFANATRKQLLWSLQLKRDFLRERTSFDSSQNSEISVFQCLNIIMKEM